MPSSTLATSHPTTTVWGGVPPSASRLANTAPGSMPWASRPLVAAMDLVIGLEDVQACPARPRSGSASTSTSAAQSSSRS